jgi:hypothetical protein
MTIGQIDAMPAEEFLGWQEFFSIERPMSVPVADAMNAHAISVLANLNRDSKTRPEPYMIRDFLLFPGPTLPPAEPPTVEGKTAEQWKLIFAAEALQAQEKRKRRVPVA